VVARQRLDAAGWARWQRMPMFLMWRARNPAA
jgi:hypothetical protein